MKNDSTSTTHKKPRKVVDWIKYKNIREATINYSALKGLKRVNSILSGVIKYGILGFFVFAGTWYAIKSYRETMQEGIKYFENKLNSLPDKERIYLNNHIKLSLDYANPKDIINAEDNLGVTYYREKLLKNANGLVLETCCGAFLNNRYYPDKVKHIIAVDWCKDILNFAILNSREDTKLVVMDCTNLDYQDNSFDTVVDTFGLQASYDHKQQYEEMKRVCKVGGKLLILEIGESLWKSTNYKTIKKAPKEFLERGQHLYRNWDNMILKDPSVRVVKSRRKLNGRLYYYELEKLY